MTRYAWLLEVVWPDGAGRAPAYFNGHVTPGWQGRTTTDPNKAVQYENCSKAVTDAKKLAPRELGLWCAVEHGFID